MINHRRGVALLAASLIALSATPFSELPAQARTVTGNASAAIVSQLDPNRLGSLEIKFKGDNPYDDLEPGEDLPAPIQGRTYQIRLVENLDITDPANWSLIETIDVEDIDNYQLGQPRTAITNSEGIARFDNLPIGVYLVEDITPPREGYTKTKSAPFLVTVPIGDPDSGGWDYSVQIVPKNLPEEQPDDNLTTIPSVPPETTPRTPPGTTVTEEPSEPGKPSTPREEPGQPGTGGQPGSPTGLGALASTGASVLGIVGLGAAMLILGAFLVRRKSEQD